MSENNKPKTVGSKEIAQLLGVTRRWVQQLTQDGIIVGKKVGNNYHYDLLSTIQRYISYLQHKAEEAETGVSPDLQIEKLKTEIDLKKSKAKIAQLEVKELESKMHRAEDVEGMTTDLISTIHSKISELPDILGKDIAKLGTAAEVSDRIKEAVIDILDDLSDYEYDPDASQETKTTKGGR
ncbi:phage terminase Nu1 subunit (DNA packaging protein) [Desulfitispora alkaliphila]|uniref:protoporphyrinogen oxidase n=1 Tax=Desulfitispora alkaliphila TaxID=622674 RepID=UPI003D254EB7